MRRRLQCWLISSLVVLLASLLAGCGGGDNVSEPTRPATTAVAELDPARIPPGTSLVATAKVPTVNVYEKRADTAPPRHQLANPTEIGGPLVFLVDNGDNEWLLVNLPVRPNGSTGWIRASDVSLSSHNFRIVVEVAAHRITVTRGNDVILAEPVALGTNDTPTPGGKFYIKELLQPPNPNTVYGPYAYGLSGFSNALSTFAGGEAVIGIHGNNDPSTLGKDVSAGCIRMSNPGITMLAKTLPLGTPVEIRP